MKKLYKKSRRSRKLVLQMLYSLEFFDVKKINFENTNIESVNRNKVNYFYLDFLLSGILKKDKSLTFIADYSFINYTYYSVLDKIIVKMAIFDIIFNKDIPLKVVINESIELTKIFSSKRSYIFINKILNNLIKGYLFNRIFFL